MDLNLQMTRILYCQLLGCTLSPVANFLPRNHHHLQNKTLMLILCDHFLGSSTVDREDIPANLVKDIRNYFQISPEYFSMLLVGKDGNVKSWYPSPMWSMAIVYDLIDSMQLRRQEMTIQQSLGMQCPDDEYGGYGYHSYHQGYQEGYQDDYRHHGSYHHGYPYWTEWLSLWLPPCLSSNSYPSNRWPVAENLPRPPRYPCLALLLFNQGTLVICLLKKCRSLYSEAIQTSSIEALNNKDSFILLNLYKQRPSAGAVCIKTKQKNPTAPAHGHYNCPTMCFLLLFLRRKKKKWISWKVRFHYAYEEKQKNIFWVSPRKEILERSMGHAL